MFSVFLTPLTIAALASGLQASPSADFRLQGSVALDTIPAPAPAPTPPPSSPKPASAPKPDAISPSDTSIPILSMPLMKRLSEARKDLATLNTKNPGLVTDQSIGSAIQSQSLSRFEKVPEFAEVLSKHNFTPTQFFAAYKELHACLFILNVEKKLGQDNLTEAQGFKVIPMNKRFVAKYAKDIALLKITDFDGKPKQRDPRAGMYNRF